jgi:hypothetical protein
MKVELHSAKSIHGSHLARSIQLMTEFRFKEVMNIQESEKQKASIISTDEGTSVQRSDEHPAHPQISFRCLSNENLISFSEVHRSQTKASITSANEGFSIRQCDPHL